MIKASKAPKVLSGYKMLICKLDCNSNILYPEMCAAPFDILIITYGRGALFRSILLDMSGIEERSERKQCRSDNNLNYYRWAYGEEPYDCHQ
jgi:hypothetical protein